MVELFNLSDEMLMKILKNVPLSDIIHNIGQVCSRLTPLQREELRLHRRKMFLYDDFSGQIYCIRNSENVYGRYITSVLRDDGSPWIHLEPKEQMRFYAVRIPRGAAGFVSSPLMNLMPSITDLSLSQCEQNSRTFFASTARLLDHYSASLVSLNIECSYDRYNARQGPSVIALFDTINRMQQLRHLTFDIELPETMKIRPQLSILSRLDTFSTDSFFNQTVLVDNLTRYAANSNVRIDCQFSLPLSDFLKKFVGFPLNFIRISIRDSIDEQNIDDFQDFCSKYSTLVTLYIAVITMPLTRLARCLSQLPALIHLCLRMFEIPPNDENPQLPLIQVPSVRYITLELEIQSHHDTERLHLAELFPNLQVINYQLKKHECTECKFNKDQVGKAKNKKRKGRNETELLERVENCLQLIQMPFAQCAKLRATEISYFED